MFLNSKASTLFRSVCAPAWLKVGLGEAQKQCWLYLTFFHDLCEEAKPIVTQITQIGAKHELMAGPLTDFMIAGDVTLDQLTGNAT